MSATLFCPDCGGQKVTVTAEQKFMVNTGEHYCFSVKTHDPYARTTCLDCHWTGTLSMLATERPKD